MSSTPGYVVPWSDYMHTDILLHVNHDLFTHFITCQPKSFLPILTMLHIHWRFCKNSLISNNLIHGSTPINLIVQVPLGPHVIQNRQCKQCRKPNKSPNSHFPYLRRSSDLSTQLTLQLVYLLNTIICAVYGKVRARGSGDCRGPKKSPIA